MGLVLGLGIRVGRIKRHIGSAAPPPMDQTNLLDIGLTSEDIDARLIYHAFTLGTNNTEMDIRGNGNPTAASEAARQELFNNYVLVNYNEGYTP